MIVGEPERWKKYGHTVGIVCVIHVMSMSERERDFEIKELDKPEQGLKPHPFQLFSFSVANSCHHVFLSLSQNALIQTCEINLWSVRYKCSTTSQ